MNQITIAFKLTIKLLILFYIIINDSFNVSRVSSITRALFFKLGFYFLHLKYFFWFTHFRVSCYQIGQNPRSNTTTINTKTWSPIQTYETDEAESLILWIITILAPQSGSFLQRHNPPQLPSEQVSFPPLKLIVLKLKYYFLCFIKI